MYANVTLAEFADAATHARLTIHLPWKLLLFNILVSMMEATDTICMMPAHWES